MSQNMGQQSRELVVLHDNHLLAMDHLLNIFPLVPTKYNSHNVHYVLIQA